MYYAIHVPDDAKAKAFYGNVFGWDYDSDGNYHHIVGSSPAGGIVGDGGRHVGLSFVVSDIGEAVATARGRGGAATEPTRSKSGWSAAVEDGRGGKVEVWQPAEGFADPNPKCGVGDLYYFFVPVVDDAARELYGASLGWEFTTGNVPGGWNIANITPQGGVFVGGTGEASVYFQVDDLDAAARRVRDAGGTTGSTVENAMGWHVECGDDQGIEFGIGVVRST